MLLHTRLLRQPVSLLTGFQDQVSITRALPSMTSLLTAIYLTALLSACGTKFSNPSPSSTSGPPDANAPSLSQSAEEAGTSPAAPTTVSPAIQPSSIPQADTPRSLPAAIALREQAAQASEAANYSRAIGLLERAIRISPSDPATFLALAENHLGEHRPQQALELTRRALTLDPTLEQQLALEALQQRCLALL